MKPQQPYGDDARTPTHPPSRQPMKTAAMKITDVKGRFHADMQTCTDETSLPSFIPETILHRSIAPFFCQSHDVSQWLSTP